MGIDVSMKRTTDMTAEEIRSLDTFKDWNEAQITGLLATLKSLSVIMYHNWVKTEKSGKVIALNIDNQEDIKTAA